MIHPQDQRVLGQWAASKPFVKRLWVFGSRAIGTQRPDSDLDVAIEIDPVRPADATAFASFHYRHVRWLSEIQPLLFHQLHLCHYNPNIPETFSYDTHNAEGELEQEEQVSIVQLVERDGILIYDAAQEQPTHIDV
jgi:predicted nucleotidyltransferase